MIGCCHNFKKCSDLGECLYKKNHPLYNDFKDCYYHENLKKGLNFYTEYNENNRRKKEEYEERLLNEETSKKTFNVPESGQTSLF